MGALFKNNARSTIAEDINASELEVDVSVGTGADFPAADGTDYFMATLFDSAGNREIIKVTNKSTDTLTIVRAQEGTSARSWTSGDGISHRLTAGEIQTTWDDLATAVADISQAESDISDLETAVGAIEDSIDDPGGLDDRLGDAESAIGDLETSVDTAGTGLLDRMTAAEGDIDDLETLTGTHTSTLSSLGSTVSGHTTSIGTNSTNITTVTNLEKIKAVSMCLFESDKVVAPDNGTIGFMVPAKLASHNLTAVRVGCHTYGSSGTTDVQIRRRRSGTDVDMLSTKVTVGAEYHAADGVINTSNDDVTTGDLIFCDVDAARTGMYGLIVDLTFTQV